MEPGPSVDDLSAAQLRLVAHIRGARPAAVFRWHHDGGGWSLHVVEARRGRPETEVVTVFLPDDGSVPPTRTLL
ncbi:MAG: hypothetical protein QOK49_4847 [Baekduia sp.]|nr:hypothetical protein [Baekduia sp.]